MKQRNFTASLIAAFVILLLWPLDAQSAPVDDLIAGAKKEGVLELYAPSTLTPAGAMTRDVGKIVSIAATGQPQEWDVMLIHDGGHATLLPQPVAR